MVSSSSSQRRMNNAPGESGPSAASPNDVHHRCRWQGNGQILVLHFELQQELAQFPEAGQTSCFVSGLVPLWKVLHGSHWTIGSRVAPAYWCSQRYQQRDAGRYYTFGYCASTLSNVPSFTPVERPMPSQNATATHTRMCVLHREKGRCAPTPVTQNSAV